MKLVPKFTILSVLAIGGALACSESDEPNIGLTVEEAGDTTGDGDTTSMGGGGTCLFDCEPDVPDVPDVPDEPLTIPDATIENPGLAGDFMVAGSYVTSGNWSGYAFSYAFPAPNSSRSPENYDSLAAGDAPCLRGVVGADSSWTTHVAVGINLDEDTEGVKGDGVVLTGSALKYSIANPGNSILRIQFDTVADDDADGRFCVEVPAESGEIDLADFNTACWDGSGAGYAGEPIEAVYVIVPSNNTADTPYEFCVSELSEVAPGTVDYSMGNGGAPGN